MKGIMGERKAEYQLRYAAGQYYLLHMEQKGISYEQPLVLNSMGAEIWAELVQGKSVEQIAEALGQKYNIETEQIRADVLQFYNQLEKYNVL